VGGQPIGAVGVLFMNGSQISSTANFGVVGGTWKIVRDDNKGTRATSSCRDGSGNLAISRVNGSQITTADGLGNVPRWQRSPNWTACTAPPTFAIRKINANDLIRPLASRLGWDDAGFKAARAEATGIARPPHRAEADACHLGAFWRILSQGPVGGESRGNDNPSQRDRGRFLAAGLPAS